MKKEKIKNIAIVFLVLMLILTLFSNTIMNYSLVEVSTQQIYSDSLTSKVRGSGIVEASESYSVMIEETRKIATVEVKTGAEVETGDVLFTLADEESEELVSKREELETAEAAYETAVLESGITVAERQTIESGKLPSLSDRQNSLISAQSEVDDAQEEVDTLTAKISALDSSSVDLSAENLTKLNADYAYTEAQDAETAKQAAYNEAYSTYEEKEAAYETAKAALAAASTDADYADLKKACETAKAEYESALSAYSAAATAYQNAQNATASAKTAVDDAQYAIDLKTLNASTDAAESELQTQLVTANTTLTAAQATLEALKNKLTAQITLGTQYSQLSDLKSEVAELEANAVGAEITAPISGTVTEILYTAGMTVQQGEILMEIQPENKAFVLSFSVSSDQAKRIKAGDEATVVNNWYGNDITATVLTIKKDASDASQYLVTCEMSGDVSVGDSYTLSIGEKSSNYDYVVPTSCIREDANGMFILVVESKSTPLGNRYYARRVSVEVLASDDSNSAITGAIEAYSYVITTTSKPVEENQQVRLAD